MLRFSSRLHWLPESETYDNLVAFNLSASASAIAERIDYRWPVCLVLGGSRCAGSGCEALLVREIELSAEVRGRAEDWLVFGEYDVGTRFEIGALGSAKLPRLLAEQVLWLIVA